MQITVLSPDGQSHTHPFEEGDNLMQLLSEHGYEEIQALCGGSCSCATCHVHIEPSSLVYAAEAYEIDLLELADNFNQELSRLSCQIVLSYENDGMQVQLVASE